MDETPQIKLVVSCYFCRRDHSFNLMEIVTKAMTDIGTKQFQGHVGIMMSPKNFLNLIRPDPTWKARMGSNGPEFCCPECFLKQKPKTKVTNDPLDLDSSVAERQRHEYDSLIRGIPEILGTELNKREYSH